MAAECLWIHSDPLVFDLEFLEIVSKSEKIEFEGIVYAGETSTILYQLPNDGRDAQHEPVYFVLPDGRAVCWTLVELVNKKPDELIQGDTLEAYEKLAKELEYEPLGMLPDDELNEFVLNPGTLESVDGISPPRTRLCHAGGSATTMMKSIRLKKQNWFVEVWQLYARN